MCQKKEYRNIKHKARRVSCEDEITGVLVVMDGKFNVGRCYIMPEVTSMQYDDEFKTFEIGGFYEVDPETITLVE